MHDGIAVAKLKSPYPYFGGKSKVVADIWKRLGKCDRYIEPFFGSGAVMLANPHWQDTKEIVNDLNHYIANCWRAIRHAPEAVAYWCDYPTIEIELHLWHIWLVNEGRDRIKQCEWDENYFDAEVAGKWLYGMANWIGGHFAVGAGCWTRDSLKAANELGTYNHKEIERQLPHLSKGRGVKRQLPHLSKGQGVNRQLPHLSKGQGVNRKLPHLSDAGRGVSDLISLFPANEPLYQYIRQLAERLIEVDVCCGDWERIVKPAVTLAGENGTSKGTAAIFLDPPYSEEAGRSSVYSNEDFSVAHRVREWCLKHGNNLQMKIALCGYDNEHKELENNGWEAFTWSANGGYSTFANKDNVSHKNKHREVIWFSPHCLKDGTLFQ